MKPKQYRKKPVVIEAIEFMGTLENSQEIAKWMGKPFEWEGNPEHFTIQTLEGMMTAGRGDYIIKGVKGEFYPCKPDIFAATYDEVTP